MKIIPISFQKSLLLVDFLVKKVINNKKNISEKITEKITFSAHNILIETAENEKILDFHLPICLPNLPDFNDNLDEYSEDNSDEYLEKYLEKYSEKFLAKFSEDYLVFAPTLVILIQAGHAAVGYFEENELVLHKVITRYMVRGNGKAQHTYLKTRGKSKAGSRIRLAQTLDFFEEINQKIDEWAIIDDCQKVLYSASIPLWNMLFESKVAAVFEKTDKRLLKIPLDVDVPNHAELLHIGEKMQEGQIRGFLNSANDLIINDLDKNFVNTENSSCFLKELKAFLP